MKRLILAVLASLPLLAGAQVDPWPWGKYAATASLAPIGASISDSFIAVASRTGKDTIQVLVYGKKPSPAYTAELSEQPGLLGDIIGSKEKTLVVRLELAKNAPGQIVPQVITPFAVTKSLKTVGDRVWLVYENKAFSLAVIEP